MTPVCERPYQKCRWTKSPLRVVETCVRITAPSWQVLRHARSAGPDPSPIQLVSDLHGQGRTGAQTCASRPASTGEICAPQPAPPCTPFRASPGSRARVILPHRFYLVCAFESGLLEDAPALISILNIIVLIWPGRGRVTVRLPGRKPGPPARLGHCEVCDCPGPQAKEKQLSALGRRRAPRRSATNCVWLSTRGPCASAA
jgi:hypothetical protein